MSQLLLHSCSSTTADDRHLTWLTLEAAIVSLIEGLPAAAQAGDAVIILHARRLTTALQVRSAITLFRLLPPRIIGAMSPRYLGHCCMTTFCLCIAIALGI